MNTWVWSNAGIWVGTTQKKEMEESDEEWLVGEDLIEWFKEGVASVKKNGRMNEEKLDEENVNDGVELDRIGGSDLLRQLESVDSVVVYIFYFISFSTMCVSFFCGCVWGFSLPPSLLCANFNLSCLSPCHIIYYFMSFYFLNEGLYVIFLIKNTLNCNIFHSYFD